MPIQQLVEYFNDRFGHEHHSSFRPILLEQCTASGLFGPVRIDSRFLPLHHARQPKVITAYAAQLGVSLYDPLLLQHQQIESLLAPHSAEQQMHFDSIINFDRLARTIHLLNYLPIAHLEQTLFIDVDPRHILGVKNSHGAYFEEIISKCGLKTEHVVLVTSINASFAPYFQALQSAFENYRRHGYQLGLKVRAPHPDAQLFSTISELAPDYLCLSAEHIHQSPHAKDLKSYLQGLKSKIDSLSAKLLLTDIAAADLARLAADLDIALVEGPFYENTT